MDLVSLSILSWQILYCSSYDSFPACMLSLDLYLIFNLYRNILSKDIYQGTRAPAFCKYAHTHEVTVRIATLTFFSIDPACWPERWKLPRQRIDVRTASHLRSSSGSISRSCKETARRRCGRSHSNAQVSDGITKN